MWIKKEKQADYDDKRVVCMKKEGTGRGSVWTRSVESAVRRVLIAAGLSERDRETEREAGAEIRCSRRERASATQRPPPTLGPGQALGCPLAPFKGL